MESTVLEAIVSVGCSEIATSEVVKNAIGILTENNILTEVGLYDWAVSKEYWNTAWPKPRSVWQEVSRGNLTGGKKIKWKVQEKIQQNTPFWKSLLKKEQDTIEEVIFQWKEDGLEIMQSVDLSIVAGLGRLSARLAVAQSRQRERTDTSEGGETGKGKGGETGKEKILTKEVEAAKTDAEKARADAEKAKAELQQFQRDVQNGVQKEKAIKAARKQTDAAIAALEEMKIRAAKVKEERDKKEETLLSIANSINKASIDAPKEELWAILEEIRDALNGKPIPPVIQQEMP